MTVASAAGKGGIRKVKRGLQALLLGPAFQDAIAGLLADCGDGAQLAPLRGASTAELRTLGDLPRVEILGVSSNEHDADAPWSSVRDHVIVLRFYEGGDNEEEITDRIELRCEAARRLFTLEPGDEHRLFPFTGGPCRPGAIDYDPIIGRKDAEPTLVKVGSIELIVTTLI